MQTQSATLKIEEYTALSSWASYLINGDASSIDDSEQAEADAFVAHFGCGSPISCEDAGFLNRPDFGRLAGDCQTYSFLRPIIGRITLPPKTVFSSSRIRTV